MRTDEKKRGASFFSLASIYLVSNLFNAVIPFILLPILTRAISPAEYGKVAMFQTTIAGLAAFVGLSVHGAAVRKYYDDNDSLPDFIGSCVQLLLFTMSITTIIIFVFSNRLQEFIGVDVTWIYIAVIVSASDFLIQLRLGQWQVRSKAISFGLLQIFRSITNLSISLLLVLACSLGAEGRMIGISITAILFAGISIYSLSKSNLVNLFDVRVDHLIEAIKFGFPLVPHVLGAFFLTAVDRVVINKYLGESSVGLYMVAFQLCMGLGIIFDSFNRAYSPWLYQNLIKKSMATDELIVKNTYKYFLILCSAIPVGFFIAPYMLLIIAGEKYSSAADFLIWLIAGQIFNGMYLMVANYIFFSKKTGLLSCVTLSCGLFNLFLLNELIPLYGIKGAAVAYALSMLCQFLITWRVADYRHPMPWFKVKIF
ncbi:oligosaccharide flippase family protein [Aeromonas veronii]|uniref:lipopolysaccharide biosynthesis protein n=1 Tax=Aeromonas veronii TaxID=654 RepID=UPI00217E2EB8|nr:oligosaccharide flippase family protein [Aeromonas veronii]UWH26761.1 oligosaccharide flippase family protein [Aeromonas veronii]